MNPENNNNLSRKRAREDAAEPIFKVKKLCNYVAHVPNSWTYRKSPRIKALFDRKIKRYRPHLPGSHGESVILMPERDIIIWAYDICHENHVNTTRTMLEKLSGMDKDVHAVAFESYYEDRALRTWDAMIYDMRYGGDIAPTRYTNEYYDGRHGEDYYQYDLTIKNPYYP